MKSILHLLSARCNLLVEWVLINGYFFIKLVSWAGLLKMAIFVDILLLCFAQKGDIA